MTVKEDRKVKTKGAAEIVVKRRLGVLKTLAEECGVQLNVQLVPSERNKADVLTRVRRRWLIEDVEQEVCCAASAYPISVQQCHEAHHLGVDRTLYLTQKLNPSVTRAEVKAVIRKCERCQSIDPAPVIHVPGDLGVAQDWKRVAIDITHYRNKRFLTIIDCGPGRYAIWREVPNETAEAVVKSLEQIFFEHGPVNEILMDNATAFRSQVMKKFMERWNVGAWFRAAYRAAGNGIIERHHRTVKRMAERAGISPIEAVFWYNVSPRSGQDRKTVPQLAVFAYEWRQPWEQVEKYPEDDSGGSSKLQVGDEVWVKPPLAKCTSKWPKGTVTAVNSPCNIEVDGIPRHVLDLRPIVGDTSDREVNLDDEIDYEVSEVEEEHEENVEELAPTAAASEVQTGRRYPARIRQPPVWMSDYSA